MADSMEDKPRVRLRSASWLLASQMLAKVVSFPMGVIIARGLGAGGKGSLSLVQMVATTAAALLGFGMTSTLTYYAARREAAGRDALAMAASIAGLVMVGLLTLNALVGDWFARHILHTTDSRAVVLGIAMVFPVMLGGMLLSLYIGSGNIRNATIVTNSVLIVQFSVYVVVWLLGRLTLDVALLIWASAVTVEAVVLAILAWRVQADEDVAPGPLRLWRRTWRYGLTMWLAATLGFTALRLDMYILAYFRTPADVGVYSIAVTLAELSWLVPAAINGVMLPKMAFEREGSLDLMLRVSRVLWPITLVVSVGVYLVSVPTVPLLFGPDFTASLLPLLLIIPGTLAMTLSGLPSTYAMSFGHPRDWTIASALNAVVNIGANIALVPRLGPAGAALASTLSYTASTVVIVAFFVRRSGHTLRQLYVPSLDDYRELTAAARRALRRES
jgi:O-antigen/teichoic acid export membrane protein